MASRLQDVIQRGVAASRPAATAVAPGTLYYSTDTATTDRSDGTNWQTYADIPAGGGITQLTGDVTAGPGSGSQSATIANDAVIFAKMQDINTDRLLGRDTAASGNVEELTVSGGIEFSGSGGIRQTTEARTRQIGITIDGGGSAITTGVKGYKSFPIAGTITSVRMLADVSGSCVIDIWKDTYANYPPTVADTITAAAKPTISTAVKSEDSTLTGWTTSINAGDIFGFNVDSATTITRVTLELTITI